MPSQKFSASIPTIRAAERSDSCELCVFQFFAICKEAAFAQLKMWQSGAIAVIFFLSPYISLQVMLITSKLSNHSTEDINLSSTLLDCQIEGALRYIGRRDFDQAVGFLIRRLRSTEDGFLLITMVTTLCVALSGFLYLTLHVEGSFSSKS